MAIRFTDKSSKERPAEAAPSGTPNETAREVGEARFASPIEAVGPVNPDAASELPFSELPKAESRKKPRKR